MSENQPIELDAGTPEIDLSQISKRSVTGIIALASRTLVVQIITFLATLALTIFLEPEIYGVFFIVSSVVNFLTYFSDIGLAAALIQKKTKITRQDLTTTFSIQQALVLLLLILLFAFTPLIQRSYGMDRQAVYLLWALGVSLFLSSLKTIPSILLERNLKFDKLIIPQIAENLVFNLVAVYLAWQGYGITAFTLAVLSRGVVGLVLMYIISPWKPGFSISIPSLKHLLKFGLPYQINTFLAVLKDDGMTILLGGIVGATGMGYIGWASRWANMPLRIFMDNITKVAFPAFSRLQSHKEKLTRAVEMNLKYLGIFVFPLLVGMAFLANPLVHIIPKYTKWLPALIPFYFYLYNAAWACVSTSLTNALNAVGKIKVTFKLMIMWTTLTWATMPFLAIKFGYLGISYAAGIIATSSIVTLLLARRHIVFNIFSSLKSSILSSLALGVVLFFVSSHVSNVYRLISSIVLGGLVYLTFIFLIEGKDFVKKTFNYFKIKA